MRSPRRLNLEAQRPKPAARASKRGRQAELREQQLLVGLLPNSVEAYLPTSILGWTVGLATGADVGFITPVAWAVSIVVLAGVAIKRMDAMEL